MRRLLVLLLAGMLTLTACSSGGSDEGEISASPSVQTLPTDVTDALAAQLTKTMSSNDVPGAAVQVCVPGYENATIVQGVSNIETGTPMTGELVWPLRSVTKSYTVTLILQLVDEGKISLDDTIDQWVDGVPNGDQITLRQLSVMSSGVPEYTTQKFLQDYLADPNREFTTQELITYAIAEPAQFPPGSKKVYVNTSTLLLGEVVAQEYGQPFVQVVSEQILQPLALDTTTYPVAVDEWGGPHPTGYQPAEDGSLEPQDNNFSIFGPAGAMTSTLDDMCAWGAALGQGELVDPATQAARVDGQPLAQGPEYDTYGQGIGMLDGWVGHTGEGLGFTVLVMNDPDSGATAVVAMNVSNKGKHVPTRYFRKIAPVLNAVPLA
ncbi:MAG: beta-lactamase family protein [Actinobacteria bacterium]|nr:beta-lactamase family protein [Micrococcales bacterium]MCB9430055.1 beta-lactamase family protein [Actinomycetota bacterium]MCO5300208.1 beta-lactamase family protein [Candidatus Nanopelagicales bacterium]HPE12917.1 serine hydrolase domain-containing protein [Actinomycetota bacterium]HPJ18914.1 serine hydrolase domain-containing protein [Actinomycetota bacterium]